PDLGLVETIRRIRSSPAIRQVSILALLTAEEPPELEAQVVQAGANAVMRRPLQREQLERWLAKLLVVARRVQMRIPVQGQVVGTRRGSEAVHFYGLTRNLSVNGMLLASPVRLPSSPDLDLEFMIPGLAPRLQALGRVVREAPEVEWPYLGYGVEFIFVPPDTQEALSVLVSEKVDGALTPGELTHGIHSTLRREDWIYEILEPVRYDSVWHAEIRRAPREQWRPGVGGPFYVVEGNSREGVLQEARDFLARYVRSA
ncbi:MAG TPA: PilZ domain-containing protein, partial [Vicinamibacteria bacterium]|nr:PilZ domain-containing protein [Vicinamibacteria bacterium]